jgi:hypothetical protein
LFTVFCTYMWYSLRAFESVDITIYNIFGYDNREIPSLHALGYICNWMLTNKLKLSDDKSELLVLRASHRPVPQFDNLLVGDEYIKPSLSASNIGIVLDNTMSMDSQIMAVCKSCFYHINCISRIRRYISFEDIKQLVEAFVISRIDYCNSLLYGSNNLECTFY